MLDQENNIENFEKGEDSDSKAERQKVKNIKENINEFPLICEDLKKVYKNSGKILFIKLKKFFFSKIKYNSIQRRKSRKCSSKKF